MRPLPAEDFLCREPELVFETTGTSGGPKRVYFSYEELDFAARYEAAALYENGVGPVRAWSAPLTAGYWISSWVLPCVQESGRVLLRRGQAASARDLLPHGRVPLRRGHGGPTWLVSFSEIAEKEGAFPLRLIMAAGDRMTDVYRATWKGFGSAR